jgi:hypothetical protein
MFLAAALKKARARASKNLRSAKESATHNKFLATIT